VIHYIHIIYLWDEKSHLTWTGVLADCLLYLIYVVEPLASHETLFDHLKHDGGLFISQERIEMFDCFRSRRVTTEEAISDLRRVETTLKEMIKKYNKIRVTTLEEFRECTVRSSKIVLLKKKKTLEHHIQQCENKIAVCVQKQYALEQLEVTKMQVDAIRSSTSVFRTFSKYNPIQKIEDLQSQMEDMTEDLADVTQLLAGSVMEEFDEDELNDELRRMEMEDVEEMTEEAPHVLDMPEVPSRHLTSDETIQKIPVALEA
tara:strand:+ start:2028 stop:2807 length:780 start_codon:yes stop_codon:yes gene_type:complete